jgi:PAS domain S-box-containing protein
VTPELDPPISLGRVPADRRAAADQAAAPSDVRSSEGKGRLGAQGNLAELLNVIPDAVLVASSAGHIRFANKAAGALFRADASALVGRSLVSLTLQRSRKQMADAIVDYQRTGRRRYVDRGPLAATSLRLDGTAVDVEITVGEIEQAHEPMPGIVLVIRPVAASIQLERQTSIGHYLRGAIEASSDAVIAISPQDRVVALNRRFSALWELSGSIDLTARTTPADLTEVMQKLVDPQVWLTQVAAVPADVPSEAEQESGGGTHAGWHGNRTLLLELKDGRSIAAEGSFIPAETGSAMGRIWFMRDATEDVRKEAEHARLVGHLRAVGHRQDFLLNASQVMARSSGFSEALDRLAAVAVPTLGDVCMIDLFQPDDSLLRVTARHANPELQSTLDRLVEEFPIQAPVEETDLKAWMGTRTAWRTRVSDASLRVFAQNAEHYAIMRFLQLSGYMTVPLRAQGRVLGCFTVASAGSGREFSEADLDLAQEFGDRVAVVVEQSLQRDEERETSHILQSSLLPQDLPALPGVAVAVRYLPSLSGAEAGGDFYDVIPLPDGSCLLIVGDVAGHDTGAAAAAGQVRTACRVLAGRVGGAAGLVEALQESWDTLGVTQLVTVLAVQLNPASGELCIASAGHLPPLMIGAAGGKRVNVEPAAPLGAPRLPVPEWTGTLVSGEALMMFTDGLVELPGTDVDAGIAALTAAVGTVADGGISTLSSEEDLADLLTRVLDSLLSETRRDDVALLIAGRR